MGDDMDWDEIWNGLDNEKNWEAEKYRAKNTLPGVQDFHKHWDRYAPLSYFVPGASLSYPANQERKSSSSIRGARRRL